jgi:UDP-2,3-diacylglucosamine hydrolase
MAGPGAAAADRSAWAAAWGAAAGAPLALPAPAEWTVPSSWQRIDFISDLHLSEQTPATFEAFRGHLQHTDADAVLVLGDLFELWVGDDARSEVFAARCVEAMNAAARRITLALMGGNRDFLIGPQLCAACGARELADPTVLVAFGQRVLLTHGDALCIGDAPYQAFRRQVRDAAWLHAFLAQPLAERLAFARELRRASDTRRQFDGDSGADADIALSNALLDLAAAPTLVHGHTHRPGSERWGAGATRHVLSDWDLDSGTDRARAEVLRLDATGFRRLPPCAAPRRG